MISVGTEALKALQLINGGAIVAILAYLGKDPGGYGLAGTIGASVGSVVVGLAAATAGLLFVYFTQYALLNEFVAARTTEFLDARSKGWTHMRWLGFAVTAAVLGLTCFGVESFLAIRAIST